MQLRLGNLGLQSRELNDDGSQVRIVGCIEGDTRDSDLYSWLRVREHVFKQSSNALDNYFLPVMKPFRSGKRRMENGKFLLLTVARLKPESHSLY